MRVISDLDFPDVYVRELDWQLYCITTASWALTER